MVTVRETYPTSKRYRNQCTFLNGYTISNHTELTSGDVRGTPFTTLSELKKRTSTTLSEHVWKLKNKSINFNIKWQVVKKVKPFAPSDKVCKLCLQEKLSFLRSAPS